MVKFLLDAGADQEHKTDEMHTALMEASMVSTNYCTVQTVDELNVRNRISVQI